MMFIPSLSFVATILVLSYLASFILFALLRIITGISIQRISWSSLRHLSYTPRDGLRLDARGLGLNFHRPTFTRPTWISISLLEFKATFDPVVFDIKRKKHTKWSFLRNARGTKRHGADPANDEHHSDEDRGADRVWETLMNLKERIKKTHKYIEWLKIVDFVAVDSSVVVAGLCIVQLAALTIAVDTRRKTVDRTRLFQSGKTSARREHPIEWHFTLRTVVFTLEGRDSSELLDHSLLNINGLLHRQLKGLRDTTVSLKLGRLKIPLDELVICHDRFNGLRLHRDSPDIPGDEVSPAKVPNTERLTLEDSKSESTANNAKAFIASILRGIQGIQFTFGSVGVSKTVLTRVEHQHPLQVHMWLKEFGADISRLDPRSPAHQMYFPPTDIAHQGLFAALSISVNLDGGGTFSEKLLYVPMITATTRTTLPLRVIEVSTEENFMARNRIVIHTNIVVTSPSIDIDTKYLPTILKILQQTPFSQTPSSRTSSLLLPRRLLPKSNVKFSVHEPVIRLSLPPLEASHPDSDEYDLLILSISSMNLDMESSYAAEGTLHYSLSSTLRILSHEFYYQTAARDRLDLLSTEAVELQVQLMFSTSLMLTIGANIRKLSITLVRSEILEGLRQIVAHLRANLGNDQVSSIEKNSQNFLRRMPSWLHQLDLQGSDFSIEIAGVDRDVSEQARGCALQVQSWSSEYKVHKGDNRSAPIARGRAASKTSTDASNQIKVPDPNLSRRKKQSMESHEGRRLTIHIRRLEGWIIESPQSWEPEPCLTVPRFEVAFTTSTDTHGHIFHANSATKNVMVVYSLARHYSVGLAYMVIQKTFASKVQGPSQSSMSGPGKPIVDELLIDRNKQPENEWRTFDFKAGLVQIKCQMPAEPPLMLQFFGCDTGKHRWSAPFCRARLTQLYTITAPLKNVWARFISIKSLRIDNRRSRKAVGSRFVESNSLDIIAESCRIAVPNQLILHNVIDNFVSVSKTIKQLHHRFRTGSNESILQKEPEGPKRVPKVSFRCRAFLFELEDGAFEWKLGVIYRLGLLEQKQRLARQEAFDIKEKRLQECRARRQQSKPSSRMSPIDANSTVAASFDDSGVRRPGLEQIKNTDRSERKETTKPMRFQVNGICKLSETARLNTDEAREKLNRFNAQSWKGRIERGLRFQKRAMKDMRSIFWGSDEITEEVEQKEKLLTIPPRPALMSLLIIDFNVSIDKPSYPLDKLPDFLHRTGKGMPPNMLYSLLIPMHAEITMGELRVTLRDYPIPLLHVPAVKVGQNSRSASFSLQTDFVIAEEFRDAESIRRTNIVILEPRKSEPGKTIEQSVGLKFEVPRTVSPVKTYAEMSIEVNNNSSTKITWATSYQAAIQEMMQVFEGFTKTPIDPSDRLGFWDKIRLAFHWKVIVNWINDSDVHLVLKGSRDPYMVTGHGAGFVLCWQNDVRWSIAANDDARKFMTVDSGDFILAIPDFGHYLQEPDTAGSDRDSTFSSSSSKQVQRFRKVVMKLSGDVQWLAGLVFERDVGHSERRFDFIPHYDVVLKDPKFAISTDNQVYDAYSGFRSHHIHLSIAVSAPVTREWSVTNVTPSPNYNSIHLTPRFFSHFFSWWSMFSGQMSLPIHQGKLWPNIEKAGKKFGRYLATIKYNLLFSPIFIGHIYKHKDAEDYEQEQVAATGIKIRLNSFMLDLHQRREEFQTKAEDKKRPTQASRMRINEVQLDFISADIRAVSASIIGTERADIDTATDDTLAAYQDGSSSIEVSRFSIPDQDMSWIDMDDFVELDWILPAEAGPNTKILPLAYSPRFTYFRQTDHINSPHTADAGESKFGNEPTHYCVMSAGNDPRRVQCELIRKRMQKVKAHLDFNRSLINEQALKVVKDVDNEAKNRERLETLQKHDGTLRKNLSFLRSMYQTLLSRLEEVERRAVIELEGTDEFDIPADGDEADLEMEGMHAAPLADYMNDFSNRFIVHNTQIKWNNDLRNIILRYFHQNSQRRGFVYYMSRRAIKFIVDVLEEQQKATKSGRLETQNELAHSLASPDTNDDLEDVQDRISDLLKDLKKIVSADDPVNAEGVSSPSGRTADTDVSSDCMALNSYHFRLLAPQIQLQSEKDMSAAILVTAESIELKVVQVMDKDRVLDEVSGLIQRRFSAAMNSLQIFISNSKVFSSSNRHLYAGNRYGTTLNSLWPPWVPFEAMFVFNMHPYGFQRVVEKTSASLRHYKYNTLRLKYGKGAKDENPTTQPLRDITQNDMDHLSFEFPKLKVVCDPRQFNALYNIVTDLLLYSEPLEKSRNEKLERIMLASDFTDLTGAPELAMTLQQRIQDFEEIKMRFQINEKLLDRDGWKSRIQLERGLATCEDELFFIMEAITISQRKVDDRSQGSSSVGLLRWFLSASEIAWHLVQEQGESLAEFQLENASYERIDNNDGSNKNLVEIEKIHSLNLLPGATYPEIISPYIDKSQSTQGKNGKILAVQWYMLEAIAGIPVVDYFEANLLPIRVELEREVGKQLFQYVFPTLDSGKSDGRKAPLQDSKSSDTTDNKENEADVMTDKSLSALHRSDSAENITEHSSGAGALELRLRPTIFLHNRRNRKLTSPKPKTQHTPSSSEHHFRLFYHSDRNKSQSRRKSGGERRNSSFADFTSISRSSTLRNDMSRTPTSSQFDLGRSKRSLQHKPTGSKELKVNKDDKRDDLTQMLLRASKNMTLAYVKIPSMVLCLSYKGRGQRNLEDVHDLVFRMPTLEYRNKTWSKFDLAVQLKKDVKKALISHAGAIVGNKFSHHKSSKRPHSRHRELATASAVPSTANSSPDLSTLTSEASSTDDRSPTDEPSTQSNVVSFSGRDSTLSMVRSNYSEEETSFDTAGTPVNGYSSQNNTSSKLDDASFTADKDQRDRESIRHSIGRKLSLLSHSLTHVKDDSVEGESYGISKQSGGIDGNDDVGSWRKGKMAVAKRIFH